MAHHGRTPAAWTASTIGIIGFIIAGWGSIVPSLMITLVGLAVALGGLIVGAVMGRAAASRH